MIQWHLFLLYRVRPCWFFISRLGVFCNWCYFAGRPQSTRTRSNQTVVKVRNYTSVNIWRWNLLEQYEIFYVRYLGVWLLIFVFWLQIRLCFPQLSFLALTPVKGIWLIIYSVRHWPRLEKIHVIYSSLPLVGLRSLSITLIIDFLLYIYQSYSQIWTSWTLRIIKLFFYFRKYLLWDKCSKSRELIREIHHRHGCVKVWTFDFSHVA